MATVSDPAAPRLTINASDGWISAAGTGDTALTLTLQGPSGAIDFADRITHIWTNT